MSTIPLTWADILADPTLRDLRYKVELAGSGRIEMSPASNQHGRLQVQISGELERRGGGIALTECSIQTTDGVRVADVAWISDARLAAHGGLVDPLPVAPEICVEIRSPSNSVPYMHHKAGLYFAAGATEVWLVELDGQRTVLQRRP